MTEGGVAIAGDAVPAQAREFVLRDEPGHYRMSVVRDGTSFVVNATSASPVTLTLRVEDVWTKLPPETRRYLYRVSVTGDAVATRALRGVAPDARIQFDMTAQASFRFDPEEA